MNPPLSLCAWAAVGGLTIVALSLVAGDIAPQPVRRPSHRLPAGHRTNSPDKPPLMRDTFYEDNNFIVRIRTTYNQTSSVTCNAILMEDQLVLAEVTCIKYHGMANIEAKYVQVVYGEPFNEQVYDVDQIYINKADPKDPGTELALLRLTRPLKPELDCKKLVRPERNYSAEFDTPVRVIGFTNSLELKENRSKVAKRTQANKYVCTLPGEINETPGTHLLKGAALLQAVDCMHLQLVGVYTRTEAFQDTLPGPKKHQDCFIMVAPQMRWFEQVRSLASLAAKRDSGLGEGGLSATQPSVVVVTVPEAEQSL